MSSDISRPTEKELSSYRPLRDTFRIDCGFVTAPGLEERLRPFHQKLRHWDLLASDAEENHDGPRIEHYDPVGNRIDRIWLPEPTRQLRREVVLAGIFENQTQVEQFAKVYLLGHLGEASVTCPLACTEGLVRVIEAVGSDLLRKAYLPKLRSVEAPLAGAQFITEKDMGSDVGALTTRAVPDGEGRWRLFGEKWFCSAVDEYFLIAARPDGAPEGTAGVGIFFVPRTFEGALNGLKINRLKEKIGTRQLPTAEVDLEGAVGFNIGPVNHGFKNLMNYVINTSRLMNAAAACGFASRAILEARNYTEQRSAFGSKIIQYPMVREGLERMESALFARRALFFKLVTEIDSGPAGFDSDDGLWRRFLINLCKYRTAVGATEVTREAILLLGGNGTIETFSILPRLYRDSLVIESWEGAHNVLALQICRDALRFPFGPYLNDRVLRQLSLIRDGSLRETVKLIEQQLERINPLLQKLPDPEWIGSNARRLVDALGLLLEVTALVGTSKTALVKSWLQNHPFPS